ncbi:Dynein intermediate chain, cytosolic [Gryllus bimaculatus]|nr:Dynein intermediate chain, cytosolic [Gryllus bimaculatus]
MQSAQRIIRFQSAERIVVTTGTRPRAFTLTSPIARSRPPLLVRYGTLRNGDYIHGIVQWNAGICVFIELCGGYCQLRVSDLFNHLSTTTGRMADRKAELERKKAKLQAIREEKERRRREKEQKDAEEAALRVAPTDRDHRKELDQMLSSLGVAPVSDVLSSLSSLSSLTPEQSNNATPEPSLQLHTSSPVSSKKRTAQLSVVSVQSTSIPPKEVETYAKQTQTANTGHERDVRYTCSVVFGAALVPPCNKDGPTHLLLSKATSRIGGGLVKGQVAGPCAWVASGTPGCTALWHRCHVAFTNCVALCLCLRLQRILSATTHYNSQYMQTVGSRALPSPVGTLQGSYVVMLPQFITSYEYNLNPGLEWEDEFTVLTYDDAQAEDEESSLPHLDGGFHSKLPPGILPHGLPQVKEVQPAVTSLEAQPAGPAAEKPKQPRELSEEEKQMIILTEEFQRFLDRSARIMERALCESVDIYTDYTGAADGEDGTDEKNNYRLSLNRWFFDERWSRNRCVTSLDWSPQFPELLVASYHSNEDSPHDPEGACLVWNTKFKKTTPEYIFHCQSAVMSATFARFHPNLILGGTYSGQIVLWDNRVQKRTPVQRTPLSAVAHTHPVYSLSVVGTQNAHNLISVSTDGKLCSWSLDMLSQPQETLELQHKQGKAVAVTSLAFPSGDVNNFVVGSEEGTVYSACRHGSKAGVTEPYEGHQGPVTGVSTHAASSPGSADFSHLFLTSSFDWTVKLWSLRENRALYSFEDNGDYVYDVAWSPVHPALFATVDGDGRLDLWNLNQDTEVPTASITVNGCPALNRVSWTPSGLHVTVGDDTGKIWVYDVGEQLAQPRHDEWSKFGYTVQELKNNQTEEDLDKSKLIDSGLGSSLVNLASLSSSSLR